MPEIIANTGSRAGSDVPQVYLTATPRGHTMRLVGFQRIELQPGEKRSITLTVDPRVIASFDEARSAWVIKSGSYALCVAKSANELTQSTRVQIRGYSLSARSRTGT